MNSIHHETNVVNVPGPEEPCWVVLICTTEPVYDPKTSEDTGILEFSLDRVISPRTGKPASVSDPNTWTDEATARDFQRWENEFVREDPPPPLPWYMPTYTAPARTAYTGFVAGGELHVTLDGEPQPISHDRPARVVYRNEGA